MYIVICDATMVYLNHMVSEEGYLMKRTALGGMALLGIFFLMVSAGGCAALAEGFVTAMMYEESKPEASEPEPAKEKSAEISQKIAEVVEPVPAEEQQDVISGRIAGVLQRVEVKPETAVSAPRTAVSDPVSQTIAEPEPEERPSGISGRIAGVMQREEAKPKPEATVPEPKEQPPADPAPPVSEPAVAVSDQEPAAPGTPGRSPEEIARERFGVLLDGEAPSEGEILVPNDDGIIYLSNISKPFTFKVQRSLVIIFESPSTAVYRIRNHHYDDIMLYAALFSFYQDEAVGENFDGDTLFPEFTADMRQFDTYMIGLGVIDPQDIGKTATFSISR